MPVIGFSVSLVGILARLLSPQQVQYFPGMAAAQVYQLLVSAVKTVANAGLRLQASPGPGELLLRVAPIQTIPHAGIVCSEARDPQCIRAFPFQSGELFE